MLLPHISEPATPQTAVAIKRLFQHDELHMEGSMHAYYTHQ